MMKKYLLLTTALLSFGSLSYASDEQVEEHSSYTRRAQEIPLEHQAFLESLNAKYAPEILPLDVFQVIAKTGVFKQKETEIVYEGNQEEVSSNLPSSGLLYSNQSLQIMRASLALMDDIYSLTYSYQGRYVSKGQEFSFKITSRITGEEFRKLNSFCQEFERITTAIASSASSSMPSSRLSPSASSDTLSTQSDPEERIQDLLGMLEQLQQENTLLKSTASSSAPSTDLSASEIAAAPAAPFAPPPPPPPSGSIASAKTSHIKIPDGLNENEGNIYKTLLSAQQRTRVNKMKNAERRDYLSLSTEERLAADLKAQRLEDERAQQFQSQSQIFDAIKARGQSGASSEEGNKPSASSSPPTEEKVTPLFEEICSQATSDEETAFKKAKVVWGQIPAPRLREVAEGYANNPLVRIMLEVMSGKTPLMSDKRLMSYFSPKGVDDTFNSLKRRVKILKAEDLPSNEEWRQAVIYALLKTRIGPYEKEAKGLIAALRS